MLTVTQAQLEGWIGQLFWPFIRIGACFMVAPAFGALFIPGRLRLVLAGAVAFLVAPLIPQPTDIVVFLFPEFSSRSSRSSSAWRSASR